MSPRFFNVYRDGVMKEVKMGMGREERDFWRRIESEDYLASCMQMTWFCVVNWNKT